MNFYNERSPYCTKIFDGLLDNAFLHTLISLKISFLEAPPIKTEQNGIQYNFDCYIKLKPIDMGQLRLIDLYLCDFSEFRHHKGLTFLGRINFSYRSKFLFIILPLNTVCIVSLMCLKIIFFLKIFSFLMQYLI